MTRVKFNESTIVRYSSNGVWYEDFFIEDQVWDIDTGQATALIARGYAVASSDPITDDTPYDTQRMPSPDDTESSGISLPADSVGVLTNDGSGTIAWSPPGSGGDISVLSDNGDGTYTHSAGGITTVFSGGATLAASIPPESDDLVGAIGVSELYARQDHKHPTQGVSSDAGNTLSVGTDGKHYSSAGGYPSFSLVEQDTGMTWVDGKAIYRIVVEGQTGDAGWTDSNGQHNILAGIGAGVVDTIVRLDSKYFWSGAWFYKYESTGSWGLRYDAVNDTVYSSRGVSSWGVGDPMHYILEYTKN